MMDKEFEEQFDDETEPQADRPAEETPGDTTRNVQDGERAISSRWDLRESWSDLDAAAPIAIKEGDILNGVVVDCQDQGIVLDIGAKYEGFIPLSEFVSQEEYPAPGDQVEVAVMRVDEDSGMIRLSKKRADYERVWTDIAEAQQSGEILTAMVTERVKGGLRVDLGVPGFVPASHVATRDVRHLGKFVGKSLRLKILEANRATNQVILSHRQVVDEERQHRREATLARLKEGVVCEGRVQNLTNYGAFIDLGGIDGLLHISEMSWTHINHPSDVMKPGEITRVVVLKIEEDGSRISLGRRQILPDPWKEAGRDLHEGEMMSVRITRIVATGAFARLQDAELEGFIPISHMSLERIKNPREVLQEGQEFQAKLVELRPQARKMTLSLVEALQEQQRVEYQAFMQGSEQASGITLGEQFGAVLGEAKANLERAQKEAEQA